MSEPPTVAAHPPGPGEGTGGSDTAEDSPTQRRYLAAVWLAAGSAVAAMVAVSWYMVVRNGGQPPGSDMIGHAAAAEWLRTLPWWDWRGWSDWFYGGQAIGVNYPPLGHAWLRFTHPAHGQMAAVALGLLVLLPWGTLRVARAVGYSPRAQRAAVGAVLVLVAAAGNMHWILPSFHQVRGFFGSWPAMLAVVSGLFCAAWAARCRGPVACGVVGGLAVLCNATVVPGVAVICVALLATSGASFRQAARWAATAGAAALATCAWWLVPFLAGWERLVHWKLSLAQLWDLGGAWQATILVSLGVAAVWAARSGSGPARRLAVAAGAGLLATLLADLFGYLRPERWLAVAVLVAAVAAVGLVDVRSRRPSLRPVRPTWRVLGIAALTVFVVVAGRLEVVPVAVWLLWWPHRPWAMAGALAWVGVLLFVPFWSQIRFPAPPEPELGTPLEAASAHGGPDAEGLVYLDFSYSTPAGAQSTCAWGHPWRTTLETGGRIRPLFGLYRETSPTAEFQTAELYLRFGSFTDSGGTRPHWFDAWQSAGALSVDSPGGAAALGARWYVACDADGNVSVTELAGKIVDGATVVPYADDLAWHRAAVEWWLPIAMDESPRFAASTDAEGRGEALSEPAGGTSSVPVLSSGASAAYPPGQAAVGVSLDAAGDSITVHAEQAGWAWLRVPWDPDWRSLDATPVRKGGPGHLVVWANEGTTELRWSIPGSVNAAAVATTGVATLAVAVLVPVNRRRGWEADPDRPRPAAEAFGVFADTVDDWAHTATCRLRQLVRRTRRRIRS